MELRIRPHARMLTTIGEDLIKDIPAAIVELVKNSYDADASFVNISFTSYFADNSSFIEIEITDDGCGMSFDTIKNAWLVPSTDYKVKKQTSPNGKRKVQGKKGIGRYASGILGNLLLLESVHNKKKTIMNIDWESFAKVEFLEDVRVQAKEEPSSEPNGTKIKITGNNNYLEMWSSKEIEKLEKELRKLISPFEEDFQDDTFEITLTFSEFKEETFEYYNYETKIEPLPILNLYNYRLRGTISENGIANLIYENNSGTRKETDPIPSFQIELNPEYQSYCGKINIDLRVYDKDREKIRDLSDKLSNNDYHFNITDIRKYLNEIAGVGIYRGGFRVRPHGDKGFDWLKLDNRRVQNPSKRIGLDQLVGFISIESEDTSKLIDKASRDGLKENKQYEGLIEIITASLSKLEDRRFVYRQIASESKNKTVNEKIESLFDFSEFDSQIHLTLEKNFSKLKEDPNSTAVKENLYKDINNQIGTIKKQKEIEFEEIKEIIAIYQGQATLGNIVSIILHEGRKNLSWFTNQIPRINRWIKKYKRLNQINDDLIDKSIDKLNKSEEETKALQKLFKKLDPLSVTRRSNKKEISLDEIMKDINDVFYGELKSNNITLRYDFTNSKTIYGFREDFIIAFTNLVENSIFWLSKDKENNEKSITVESYNLNNSTVIEFKDNGPGIEEMYIEKDSIFQPGFTTKVNGTGLGLAISGESISRNNGRLKSISSNEGAHFIIELN